MKEKAFKSNSYYEGLFQNLYGGGKGCFVAFMQFFYQCNQAATFNEEFSACFEKLFKFELKNCEILSKILIKMGGDNKFYSSAKKFLSGYNVTYHKSIEKMFLEDVELLEINILDVKGVIYKLEDERLREEIGKILTNKKEELKLLKEVYFKSNLIK
ncbi:MAG: hypothetical protein J6K39_03775 [Clostridia bacterium]|nr:hypothetical protein [Clostridia bacterium]